MIIHMYCSTGCAVVIKSCSRIQLRSHPSHHFGPETVCSIYDLYSAVLPKNQQVKLNCGTEAQERNAPAALVLIIQPASEASGLAEGQRARFAREAATRFYPPPTPSGAVGHNPKSGSGQFLGRTSLEMHFTRVGVKSKIGHTTRVDAYVCLALHAGRVKRVKCVKRAILGKIREWHFLTEAPLNSP